MLFGTRCQRTAVIVASSLACLLSCGCKQHSWPDTYPVTGKVVTKSGQPHTSGLITFVLATDPEAKSTGSIGTDGTFTLNTISMADDAESKLFAGRAPAGEYFVNIYPYPGGAGGGRGSYTLKKKYTIEAQEANDLTIVMEPVKK